MCATEMMDVHVVFYDSHFATIVDFSLLSSGHILVELLNYKLIMLTQHKWFKDSREAS